jgi:acid phosphatase (class A)
MKQPGLTIPCLALLIVTVSWPARAQQADARQYLPAGSVDAAALIGPPPAPDSPALAEQMAIVLWLQHTRTPAQVAFVQQDLDLERFAPELANALVEVDGLELKGTLDDAIAEVRADYDALKDEFDLKRPFEVNDVVQPVADARPVAAYPSGHAVRATVYARLLSAIFPDHADALLELARQIGYGRVIGGVHYPIDVVAGQTLGEAYADVIVEQPAFRDAVERIRGRQPPSRGNSTSQ